MVSKMCNHMVSKICNHMASMDMAPRAARLEHK